jgi:hypothetical protein
MGKVFGQTSRPNRTGNGPWWVRVGDKEQPWHCSEFSSIWQSGEEKAFLRPSIPIQRRALAAAKCLLVS